MANKALKVVTITIGGVVYTAKATIGMYAKACEIAGADVSELFKGKFPSPKVVMAFAQVISGMSADEIADGMAFSEYPEASSAIMHGVVGYNEDDATAKDNKDASPSSSDDEQKN